MLPFKDTPKVLKEKGDPYKRVAVILEPHEAKVGYPKSSLKSVYCTGILYTVSIVPLNKDLELANL